jgi:hypothetical protein
METHEIIAEIREFGNEWFELPYLIPLTDTIERCRQYVGATGDAAIAFEIIKLSDDLQQCDLCIGLFVAAKDGKPLKEPTYTKSDGNFEGSFKYQKSIILYRKAQQEVIFEGWEVLEQHHKKAIQMHNKATGFNLEQLSNGEFWLWSSGSSLSKRIKSIADLAEATQSNPLKLK